jgi:hypothetical protein
MKTRIGKIAQLPKSIRDQLNRRLENGEQGPELLKWLNRHPKTKNILAKKFDNQPVTKSNLSDWRHGGYLEWRSDQARQSRIQRISESGNCFKKAETGDLFENFARFAVAELMADLDTLPKLRGEKRSNLLHQLIRDLARLQHGYNHSRRTALAWCKYNDDQPGTAGLSVEASAKSDVSPASASTPETVNTTSSPATPVVPDCAESCSEHSHDSAPETKPSGSSRRVIHFTRCECYEPCPKCHAPDSEYPLDEAIPDREFYRQHTKNPCDRHGNTRYLINCYCDCFCDRCAEKYVTPLPSALRAEPMLLAPIPTLKPAEQPISGACNSLRDSNDEKSTVETNASSLPAPQPAISPASPQASYDPHADFLRKMSHLKTLSR